MNELKNIEKVTVNAGSIIFKDFENVKAQAREIAEYIKNTDTTEENIAEVKKVITASRKVVKQLSDKRIEIKKTYLVPYDNFEKQVKEISDILAFAEADLTVKVKEFNEKEKAEKYHLIQSAYEHTISDPNKAIVTIDWVIRPEFLNKSFSMTKVLKELQDFNEKITSEYDAIINMENSSEILAEYLKNKGNLSNAIMDVTERFKAMKRASEIIPVEAKQTLTIDPQEQETANESSMWSTGQGFKEFGFYFQIFDELDAVIVRQFMEQNEIPFNEVK